MDKKINTETIQMGKKSIALICLLCYNKYPYNVLLCASGSSCASDRITNGIIILRLLGKNKWKNNKVTTAPGVWRDE